MGLGFLGGVHTVSGTLIVIMGALILVTVFFTKTAYERAQQRVDETTVQHDRERETETKEIKGLESKLQSAHPDSREMISDELQQRKSLYSRRAAARESEMNARQNERDRASSIRSIELAEITVGWFGALSTTFFGVVVMALGQVFSAFRDIAINSHILVDRKRTDEPRNPS